MNARTLSALALAAGVAAAAHAQIGAADFRWQASLDGGASWHGDWLDVPEATPSVRVRALVSWSADAGYAFFWTRFDALVVAGSGGFGDGATGLVRPHPFGQGSAQTLMATRFANTLKLDDSRDTSPPGEGARWIQPSQFYEQWNDDFSRSRPASIFEFQLDLDGTTGARLVTQAFGGALPDGNTTDRVLRIYTTAQGDSNIPLTTAYPLTINVLPAPGAALPLLAGVFAQRSKRLGRDRRSAGL